MANPLSAQRNKRLVLFLLVALGGLCVCGVLAVGAMLQFTGSAAPPPAPTSATGGGTTRIAPTSAAAPPRAASPTIIAGSPPTRTRSPSSATQTPAPVPTVVEPATGELHFDYPLMLLVNKDEIVQVEIVPDRRVALAGTLSPSAPSARLLIENSPNDPERRSVSYAIPLYPVMSAQLATARTEDLNIVAGSEAKQMIDPYDRNFWTWSIVAKRGGEYRITLRLFGYNSLADADPARQVVNDTRILNVQERPLLERAMQGIADNWLILFGAGGPIALIVAIFSLWFARREIQKPKS